MVSFIIRLFSHTLALYIAYLLVPGLVISNGLIGFVVAGLFLGLLNLTVKPILKFISAPIIILSLGIFSLIINGLMLWLVSYALDFVIIQTWSALMVSTIIITVANMVMGRVSKAMVSNQHE